MSTMTVNMGISHEASDHSALVSAASLSGWPTLMRLPISRTSVPRLTTKAMPTPSDNCSAENMRSGRLISVASMAAQPSQITTADSR